MESLSESQVDQLLDQARFAHIAVISDGDPYVGPLSFVRHENALYFRTVEGERVEALRLHPRAAVSIVEFDDATGSWESVLVRGEVGFRENESTDHAIVVLFLQKYRDYHSELGSGPRLDGEDNALGWIGSPEIGSDDAVMFSLEMREITGRTSGRWMTPGTRPGRL